MSSDSKLNDQQRQSEDAIMADARAARESYARKFNFNLAKMCADMRIKRLEYEKLGLKFVTLPLVTVTPRRK